MNSHFDLGSENSPLFRFIAEEFNARGTELRKRLANKTYAGQVASDLGLRSALKYATLSNPGDFLRLDLPEQFALKYAHGWSSRGIMLLQDLDGSGTYFDHLSQRTLSSPEIINIQQRAARSFPSKPDEWIVEELLPATTPGPIPFDYKFYTFRDTVGMIVQIDRNTSPVKIAIFDGEFNPLLLGRDYILTGNAQPGQHLLPKHPLQALHWASVLAQQTDAPFVSIDLFDAPEGPVFGEFTFSPGGLHKRMWTLSHEAITMLDTLFNGEPSRPARSWNTAPDDDRLDSQTISKMTPGNLARHEQIPSLLYTNWSRYLYNGGRRGAVRAAEHFEARSTAELDSDLARAIAQRWRSLPLPPTFTSTGRRS